MINYDVILPLYRPHAGWEEHIIEAVKGLCSRLDGENSCVRFYINNDGAPLEYYPQSALDAINDAAGGKLHFIPYEVNRGKGYCLRFLTAHADGDYLVYTDGDFPFGWEAAAQVLETLRQGSDVVMGSRGGDYKKALSPMRTVLSKGARFLNLVLLGLPPKLRDTQAGLKGFNRRGREIFLKTTVDKFVFDTEFILLAHKNKLVITPLPIAVKPGLKLSSMGFKVMVREFLSFLRIVWKIRVLRKY